MGRMSTVVTWQASSTSSEATEQLAERLGRAIKGGEVIELVSDLGGGKTTFVRGFARGAGSTDRVASPTFTISRAYEASHGREIHHFDFYRLHEPGLMSEELAETLSNPHAVVIVEWADLVKNVLPAKRLTIVIEKTPFDEGRRLLFRAPESLDYLIQAVRS